MLKKKEKDKGVCIATHIKGTRIHFHKREKMRDTARRESDTHDEDHPPRNALSGKQLLRQAKIVRVCSWGICKTNPKVGPTFEAKWASLVACMVNGIEIVCWTRYLGEQLVHVALLDRLDEIDQIMAYTSFKKL